MKFTEEQIMTLKQDIQALVDELKMLANLRRQERVNGASLSAVQTGQRSELEDKFNNYDWMTWVIQQLKDDHPDYEIDINTQPFLVGLIRECLRSTFEAINPMNSETEAVSSSSINTDNFSEDDGPVIDSSTAATLMYLVSRVNKGASPEAVARSCVAMVEAANERIHFATAPKSTASTPSPKSVSSSSPTSTGILPPAVQDVEAVQSVCNMTL